jgi:phosphoadenosine phosphosulfate reductase
VQHAERIALRYDSQDGYWLGFSGGKDSQALLHITQLASVRFKPYFSPTSVDPAEVIRFIRRNYPEVEFTPLKTSIYNEFIRQHALPSRTVRWCCATFKEQGGGGKVTLVGVRHAESAKRSRRQEVEVSGHKFSGNLSEFDTWSKERRRKKDKNFDQFSQHREQMVTCIGGKDKIIVSPIIEWTEQDVWEFLNNVVEVPHCELYDQGRKRIGCICCPMASMKDTVRDCRQFPHVKHNWIRAIIRYREQMPQLSGVWSGNFLLGEHSVTDETEQQKRDIAEGIFDWWISKLSYRAWYAQKYQQLKLDL